MPQYNTTAIVLRRTHFGETDNILTLFAKEHGKVSAIAKGARKAISKLSGASDPLTCSKFALATSRGSLQVVAQAEMIDAFPGLHASVEQLAQGQYFAELISVFTAEDDPHPELFQLLLRGLRLMENAGTSVPIMADLSDDTAVGSDGELVGAVPRSGGHAETIARWYEINLLGELGYAPDLTQCAVCGRALPGEFVAEETFGLSASQGSALCPLHSHPDDQADHTALSHSALTFLQEIEAAPEKASVVAALRPPDRKSEDQARIALRRHIRYHAERDLKTAEFLDGLRFGKQ